MTLSRAVPMLWSEPNPDLELLKKIVEREVQLIANDLFQDFWQEEKVGDRPVIGQNFQVLGGLLELRLMTAVMNVGGIIPAWRVCLMTLEISGMKGVGMASRQHVKDFILQMVSSTS